MVTAYPISTTGSNVQGPLFGSQITQYQGSPASNTAAGIAAQGTKDLQSQTTQYLMQALQANDGYSYQGAGPSILGNITNLITGWIPGVDDLGGQLFGRSNKQAVNPMEVMKLLMMQEEGEAKAAYRQEELDLRRTMMENAQMNAKAEQAWREQSAKDRMAFEERILNDEQDHEKVMVGEQLKAYKNKLGMTWEFTEKELNLVSRLKRGEMNDATMRELMMLRERSAVDTRAKEQLMVIEQQLGIETREMVNTWEREAFERLDESEDRRQKIQGMIDLGLQSVGNIARYMDNRASDRAALDRTETTTDAQVEIAEKKIEGDRVQRADAAATPTAGETIEALDQGTYNRTVIENMDKAGRTYLSDHFYENHFHRIPAKLGQPATQQEENAVRKEMVEDRTLRIMDLLEENPDWTDEQATKYVNDAIDKEVKITLDAMRVSQDLTRPEVNDSADSLTLERYEQIQRDKVENAGLMMQEVSAQVTKAGRTKMQLRFGSQEQLSLLIDAGVADSKIIDLSNNQPNAGDPINKWNQWALDVAVMTQQYPQELQRKALGNKINTGWDDYLMNSGAFGGM